MDITLIIVGIVFIVLAYLLINRIVLVYKAIRNVEKFKAEQCRFEPQGKGPLNCIDLCMSENERLKDRKGCSFSKCNEICNECTKDMELTCPWDRSGSSDEEYDITSFGEEDMMGKLSPVYITVQTFNNACKVNFKRPNDKLTQINGYVYYLYKTNDKSEGVKIGEFPSSKCDINCEYNIESLDNDVSYTIGVKAYNDNGMAPMSNLVKFIPKYKSGETIYNITNPFNHSIDNYSFCE